MDNEQEHLTPRSNWSETVEDLVTAGDTDAAISLLQSVVSDLQISQNSNPDPQLAAALTDLSALYSSKGLSLKADDIAAKAFLLKHQAQVSCPTGYGKIVKEDRTSPTTVSLSSVDEASVGTGNLDRTKDSPDNAVSCAASLDDDDWEAIADRPPNEFLSLESEPDKPEPSVKEMKAQTPRRRGRGTFSYNKHELYSDKLSDSSTTNDTNEEDASRMLEGRRELKSALEVLNHVRCPFTLRQLDENDTLLSSIPQRDLVPPKQRPKTSARTAQRLIAQGMGLKLPHSTTSFGSKELRKQEEDRRNRIVSRQKLRDEAWGDDDPS
ncbi:uncharacterized protein LOC103491941 isoform X2 [Cucumis melo]|uniref:Uncharacterized protein LOC103491941 isoform X2 n=1 Tax=Cucumis melo TaxID=3656 RepID=A0A1S3BPK1_CUCME|nr:uncharacterized protein LOC103491941 isoform X2 [Cucumis melo]